LSNSKILQNPLCVFQLINKFVQYQFVIKTHRYCCGKNSPNKYLKLSRCHHLFSRPHCY